MQCYVRKCGCARQRSLATALTEISRQSRGNGYCAILCMALVCSGGA